jgi:DNA-binding MarR family transcriptional regulator
MLERVEEITLNSIKDVENEFLTEEGNILFKEEFNSLSSKERLIVANIAGGCYSPKEMANTIGDKVSNINRFLMYLIEKGYVEKVERGYYALEDPVFERWLKVFILPSFQS